MSDYREAATAFYAHNRRTDGARNVRVVRTVTYRTFWQRVLDWLNKEVW